MSAAKRRARIVEIFAAVTIALLLSGRIESLAARAMPPETAATTRTSSEPAPSSKPAPPSDCQAVLNALDMLYTTPYHSYSTQTGAEQGKSISMETIFSGGTRYVLLNGKWSASTLSTADVKQLEQRARKNARNMTCQFVRDEAVNGEIAGLYEAHEETEHGSTENRLWISRMKGLVLREETDLDPGGATVKSHISLRYDYSDVHPPKL